MGAHGIRIRVLGTLLALAALGGCASRETFEQHEARTAIVKTATDELGVPYRFGGVSPDQGFDCSGLVQFSYRAAGITLPRTTSEIRDSGKRISLSDARPGDLLFYKFKQRRHSTMHVGIYLGDGKMVHAPSSGGVVETTQIADIPWPDRFVAAVRVLP